MPRYLGIDHGSKRIGLAVSDADAQLATPLAQIRTGGSADQDLCSMRAIIEDYGVDALVVGLPLNMDGTEGPQAKLARRYGAELGGALGLPVEFWDERLSSDAADRLLRQRPELTSGKRRARRDALAAAAILQDFLDQGQRPPVR